MNHSTLSQILRGKRRFSHRGFAAIGKSLGLPDELLKAHANISRKGLRGSGKRAIPVNYKVDLDTFQMLSAWYHYAILELLQVDGFKHDSRWIAEALSIETHQVNIALQRLMRLGLLEMAGRKQWIDKSGDAEFSSTALTEKASDQVNREIHELACEVIERVPGRCRVHQHAIAAINVDKLPQLRILVDEFMSEVRALLSDTNLKTDVYQLEVSVFPVTTLRKKGSDS